MTEKKTHSNSQPRNSHTQKSSSKSQKKNSAKNKVLYCQDIVGNVHLYAGLIFTDSGDCIDIIEIQPINYYQKSPVTQKDILMSYISLQRILPDFVHFKVRMEAPGISALVNNMYQRTTTNEHLLAQAQEQAEKIESLRNENAKRRKYYLIYKYEGKKFDKNEIVDEMYETRTNIVNAINNMGHMVTTPNPEIINELIGETLYRHFNPKSSIEQDFRSRLMRLFNDEELYNRTHQKEKHFNDCDFVTQRGIRIVGSQAIISDGIYHTYLIIEDTSYPTYFHGVDYLTTLLKKVNGLDYDIDTYSIRKNRGFTISLLNQTTKFTTLSSNQQAGKNKNKQMKYQKKADFHEYIKDALEEKDEDFFDCFTFITIREKTYDKLMKKKRSVITTLKQYSVYVEETHNTVLDMYKMAMPFMHIDKQIFQKNSRNFLSESMPFFYWYTTSEFSDDSGIVIGINALNNNSIASINPFNASLHVNPHMAILGTSGAGKTYFQQMLARRLFFSNVKCMFIIPAKGYEYRDSCLALDGSYIKIAPGSGVCINPMEIRPLHNYDNETSLLSMKVISLTTLLQFLVKGDLTTTELARFPVVVKNLYKEFGITDDNDSLFDSEGNVKTMPILSDLRNELLKDKDLQRIADALLPFIEGAFSNMNGQTNINVDNDYTVFDAEERLIGKQLFPAVMFIIFELCKDVGMYDKDMLAMIFLDEVWKMLINQYCADQITEMIKLLRGYGTGVCVATQDIIDFFNAPNDAGKHLLSNIDTKFILRLNETEINMFDGVVDLSEYDKANIRGFKQGWVMVVSNGEKIPIFTTSTNLERYLYENKKKRKEEILAQTGLELEKYLTESTIKTIRYGYRPEED